MRRARGRVGRALGAGAALCLVLVAVAAVAGAAASSGPDWRAKVDPALLRRAGGGQTTFFVRLARKADLAPAYALRTKEAKGRFVYQRLTETARATQQPVLAELGRLGVRHRSFWIVNAVWAVGDLGAVQAMASRPDVARVYSAAGRSGLVRPVRVGRDPDSARRSARTTVGIEPGITNTRAPEVWALGYTGQGVVVASGDTGVRWTHNALKNHYRGWNGTTADHDYNWHDAIHSGGGSCGASTIAPCDDTFHGSHTVGSMVGDDSLGNQIGMAPGAKWIACRNMDDGNGTPTTYLECMQWFMAPTKINGTSPDSTKAPDVVNNSWSCPPAEGCPSDLLRDQLAATRAAGIFYSVSAGNSGSACNTVVDPLSVYANAFDVGAISAPTNTLASFSSRGTATDQMVTFMKPNVSAPGVNIRSSTNTSDVSYSNASGTSMAAPHVAGLVALIISAKPSLRGQVAVLENIIQQTANPAVTVSPAQTCGGVPSTQIPNNSFGWGRIDAKAAVDKALSPTAVTVRSFGATRTRSGVSLRWQTGSEAGVLAFRVSRGAAVVARVRAHGGLQGAAYRVADRSARPGRRYVYRLEELRPTGWTLLASARA